MLGGVCACVCATRTARCFYLSWTPLFLPAGNWSCNGKWYECEYGIREKAVPCLSYNSSIFYPNSNSYILCLYAMPCLAMPCHSTPQLLVSWHCCVCSFICVLCCFVVLRLAYNYCRRPPVSPSTTWVTTSMSITEGVPRSFALSLSRERSSSSRQLIHRCPDLDLYPQHPNYWIFLFFILFPTKHSK